MRRVDTVDRRGLTDLARGAGAGEATPEVLESYQELVGGTPASRRAQYATVVNQYYDLVTDFFEYGWGQSFHFAPRARGEALAASILRHEHWLALRLGLGPSSHVLDVGCGVGGPMRSIARFSDCRVTGINNNAYQAERAGRLNARAGLADRCVVVEGDFMAMKLPNHSLDAAFAIEATVHAPSLAEVYREVGRVLKPGALFATYEWCMTSRFQPSDPTHQALKRGIEIGNGLVDIATSAQARAAMQEAGFEVLEAQDRCAGGDIPWWEPLAPAASPWRLRRTSGVGRSVTNLSVRVLETLRIAPRGTTTVAQLLEECGRTLVAAGQAGIFTPGFFILGRNGVP